MQQMIATSINVESNQQKESQNSIHKVLLIDDDSLFRNLMVQLGKLLDIEIHAFSSILDFDNFSKIADYHGVVFDYHLEHMNGVAIFSHLRPFISNKPTFLVSADLTLNESQKLQVNQQSFVFLSKQIGAPSIIEKISKTLLRR